MSGFIQGVFDGFNAMGRGCGCIVGGILFLLLAAFVLKLCGG